MGFGRWFDRWDKLIALKTTPRILTLGFLTSLSRLNLTERSHLVVTWGACLRIISRHCWSSLDYISIKSSIRWLRTDTFPSHEELRAPEMGWQLAQKPHFACSNCRFSLFMPRFYKNLELFIALDFDFLIKTSEPANAPKIAFCLLRRSEKFMPYLFTQKSDLHETILLRNLPK